MSSERVVEVAAPGATTTLGSAGAGGVEAKRKAAPRSRRWIYLAAAVLVVAAAVGAWRYRAGAAKPLDQTLIVPARRGDLAIDVIETGKVQPHDKVDVKSQVAGQVEKVFVDEGERVKAGQLLLRLDPTNYRRDVAQQQATVAKAAADVMSAKNAIEFARVSLARKQKGLAGRGVAELDVEMAESDVKAKAAALATAEALLAGARVALAAADDRLRYTKILSPMDGTVIERGIQPGEVVTPGVQATFEGKALLTIADLATLEVKSDLNQIDVAKVKLGQLVTLTLDALPGRKYQAKVTRIAPASTVPKGKDVDVFPIEATITDADGDIKPGMTADVRIHVDTRKGVLALPLEALVKDAGRSYVNRVTLGTKGQQTTDKVEVQVGARNDREVEITSGLGEGERVLIKPASSAENEYK